MGQHNFGCSAEEGYANQHLIANFAVCAHHGTLLDGARLHEVLEVALIVAILEKQTPMVECAARAEKKLFLFKGFENVVVGTATNRLQSRGYVVHGRNHDHRDLL